MLKKLPSFLFCIALLSCSSMKTDSTKTAIAEKPLAKVSLALNWFAEVEHAGYFAAKTADYYKDAGLDVEIIPGGPDVPVIQRVAAGDAAFGIANADEVLIARAQQVPVIALMAPIQHTPMCIVVHKDSGISKLTDLKNLTLAMTPSSPYTLYARKKLPLENVNIVPYSGNVANFLTDKKFAQQGYVFSEPFVIKEQGGDSACLSIKEIGFDPYTSVLITSEKFLKEHEDQAAAMTKASVKGWVKYVSSPAPTAAAIKSLNPQMTNAILKYGFETIRPMVLADAAAKNGPGAMRAERWQTLLDQLVEIGAVKVGAVKAEEAYTLKYLKR